MPEVWVDSASFSVSDFARLKSRVGSGFLLRDSREFVQITGRIQFLGGVGLSTDSLLAVLWGGT